MIRYIKGWPNSHPPIHAPLPPRRWRLTLSTEIIWSTCTCVSTIVLIAMLDLRLSLIFYRFRLGSITTPDRYFHDKAIGLNHPLSRASVSFVSPWAIRGVARTKTVCTLSVQNTFCYPKAGLQARVYKFHFHHGPNTPVSTGILVCALR